MKNKNIILFVLLIFFAPAISQAYIVVPTANLTVNVTTQTEDNNFNFNITMQAGSDPAFYDYQQFSIQTSNLSGSYPDEALAFTDINYLLTQESIAGLKINSILCTSDNPNDIFWYQPNGVKFSPILNENITCTFNNVKAFSKTPVLIVPGLMGTEILENSEKIWPDGAKMATSISDNFMDVLAFDKNLEPIDGNVVTAKVLSRELVFDYTESLINEFQSQGYIENETLFTFPYDWRYGVSGKYSDGKTNVDLLKQKIAEIIKQTGSDKVDIVAHSMGGLIVKKYVMDNSTNHKINKAVFVGVPNTGAPKAVKVLLQGDNFGIPWLNDSEMKKIAENLPASYDLLPSQQYYNQKGSYIETIDQTQSNGITPYIIKDLNYQESNNFLKEKNFNSLAISGAESLHTADFDNYDLRTAGVNLFAIDGCKTATVGKITEVKNNALLGGSTEYKSIKLAVGDGTVPLESATNLPIDQNNKYYTLVSDHGKMLSSNGSRQKIVNLIAESSLDVQDGLITQDISKCQLNGKAISVFSPVNVFVVDQNGNRLGLADDGSIINEIPGADFEVWGDHKFIFLPTDNGQIYTTSLTGTGSGTYTIKSEDIKNTKTIKTEVFSNLPVTSELTGKLNLNANNSTTLLIKENLKSEVKTILPSATLTGKNLTDILPPTVKATVESDFGHRRFYRGEAVVKIIAKDKGSGVLNIQYKLDDGNFQKIFKDKIEIKVRQGGKHTITFFATDKAGNNGQEQTINFQVIDFKKLPCDKNQCKKDGWKKFDGEFINQGECVDFAQKIKPKNK